MTYVAVCLTCGDKTSTQTYADRGDWVGSHRVNTGHQVWVGEEDA